MRTQLTFDLPGRAASGRADFFVSDANRAAVAAISDWQNWAGGKLVLCGPKGAGKSHLAHVWAAEAQAQVLAATALSGIDLADLVSGSARIAVEDVEAIGGDSAAELALMHLHNMALAAGGRLLLTGRATPAQWPLTLPDLKSRMQGTGLTQLTAPDDALLSAVLVKLFADRQIAVSHRLIAYVVPRIERSFAAAGQLVTALDARALATRRGVTRDLARAVLDDIVWQTP